MKKTLVLMDSSYRGWILEGIVRESAEALGKKISIVWIPNTKRDAFRLINARSWIWFFWPTRSALIVNQKLSVRINNSSLMRLLASNLRNLSIYFTHETEIQDFVKLCNDTTKIRKIITFNNSDKNALKPLVRPEIELMVSYGAVDRSVFKPLTPGERNDFIFVLIVGIMSSRKNPVIIKQVIENHPNYNFIIHGENWENLWGSLSKQPRNLEIRKFNFELHPDLIRRASCLLTISELEGGPYPTLEALASGTPVVASRTGWNPELVNERNGSLIEDLNSSTEIGLAIENAFLLKSAKMYEDLLPPKYDWSHVGRALY